MPASREVSYLSVEMSFAREVVKMELESGSWRISTVRSRCHGTDAEDTAGWKRLSGCCGDRKVWRLALAL
jgi:hypothetical protein